jgi:hypothetical protein
METMGMMAMMISNAHCHDHHDNRDLYDVADAAS